jgi:hypothetical protein
MKQATAAQPTLPTPGQVAAQAYFDSRNPSPIARDEIPLLAGVIDRAIGSSELLDALKDVAHGYFGAKVKARAARAAGKAQGISHPAPEVLRRTFEANKFPVGSLERDGLNLCPVTSAYLPGERYVLKAPFNMSDGSTHPTQPFTYRGFRTKAAALAALACS